MAEKKQKTVEEVLESSSTEESENEEDSDDNDMQPSKENDRGWYGKGW